MMALLDYTSVNTVLLLTTVLIGLLIALLLIQGPSWYERSQERKERITAQSSPTPGEEEVRDQGCNIGQGDNGSANEGEMAETCGLGEGTVIPNEGMSEQAGLCETLADTFESMKSYEVLSKSSIGEPSGETSSTYDTSEDTTERSKQASLNITSQTATIQDEPPNDKLEDGNEMEPVLMSETTQDEIESSLKAAGDLDDCETAIKEGWIVLW